MEHLKVFNSFTETNILHRYLELVADSDDDTSLGRTVKFCDCKLVYLSCGDKLLGLFESILACRAVKDEATLRAELPGQVSA